MSKHKKASTYLDDEPMAEESDLPSAAIEPKEELNLMDLLC